MSKHNIHNKAVGSSIERSKERIYDTGEVFTPMELCYHMVSKIPLEKRKDPNSIFMDNTAGNGNFMVALRDELIKYHPEDHVLNKMLYAVELMEDNHKEMCERLGVSIDHPHFLCANALEYDYSFGEPIGLEPFM
jgi:hypothetical protein